MSKEIVDSSSDRGYPCCWILRIFCSAKGSKTNVCCCLEKNKYWTHVDVPCNYRAAKIFETKNQCGSAIGE